jgi:MscS family membrane protein
MRNRCHLWLSTFGLVVALFLGAQAGRSQSSASQIVNKITGAQNAPGAAATVADPLGRGTPHGCVFGFLQSAQHGDYKTAAQYLQLTPGRRKEQGEQQARELKTVLDVAFFGRVNRISDQPEGTIQVGLPKDRERVGTLAAGNIEEDFILVRVTDPEFGPIWMVSSDTLAKLPDLYTQTQLQTVEKSLPPWAVHLFLGMPLWQWLAMLVLIPLAALLAWFLLYLLLLTVRLWPAKKDAAPRPARKVSRPALILLAVILHRIAVVYLTIPLLHRAYYGRLAASVFVIASAWLLWKLLYRGLRKVEQKAIALGKAETGSMVRLGERILKLVLFLFAALLVLRALGFDMTTALAGIGIGGLAIALAAQRTIENLIAGLSLLGDAVIRVGDSCRFGDRVGTVEDISLRSTRIRTVEGTELCIPNGSLATMSVENFTLRNKILFSTKLGLRYETTAEQLRAILAESRRMLYEHPLVEQETARIRFAGFDASALSIELFCYLATTNYAVALAAREDVLFRLMDIVYAAGSAFTSTNTVYLAPDSGVSKETVAQTEQRVKEWRAQGDFPFPDFHPDEIPGMRGQIVYPVPESSVRKKTDSDT